MNTEPFDLRYPIGRPHIKMALSNDERLLAIRSIEETPERLRAAVEGLNNKQLDTHYREGGWTVREVVHHIADSHLNAYIRMKLALAEDAPTVKPYGQAPGFARAD
jgi:exoribonuclease II